jgi:hypothetical protein
MDELLESLGWTKRTEDTYTTPVPREVPPKQRAAKSPPDDARKEKPPVKQPNKT